MNSRTLPIIASLLFATLLHAETASLKMRFVFGGKVPARQQVDIPAGLRPDGDPIRSERLLIDPMTKGIRNVIVYLDSKRGRPKLNLAPYRGVTKRMVAENTRFKPHILLARAGDTLELIDRGPSLHNPNVTFFKNTPQGFMLPPGNPKLIRLAQSEPAPIPVRCNIHPWMQAYLVILDHPFAAISDENGEMNIRGLPAITKLVFRVFHEAGRIDSAQVGGQPTAWPRARFELALTPGMNDLGDILVSNDTLLN